jgi:hypothetical protein
MRRLRLVVSFSIENAMKCNPLLPAFLALLLSAAPAIHAEPRLELLGEPAPVATVARTIVISPDTRWVNVTSGEIVKFVVGERAFVWHFNGPDYLSFPLNRVAPQGILDRSVHAYVAPNPLYIGR